MHNNGSCYFVKLSRSDTAAQRGDVFLIQSVQVRTGDALRFNIEKTRSAVQLSACLEMKLPSLYVYIYIFSYEDIRNA